MNISLISLDENEDGSAECELRMDAKGKEYLLELGFNALLKMSLDALHEDGDADEFFLRAKAVTQEIDNGEYEAPLSFDKEAQIHEKAYLEGWNDGFELGKKTIRDEA